MALENRLGITDSTELAREEERIRACSHDLKCPDFELIFRLAALLVSEIHPVFAFLAPCQTKNQPGDGR